MLSASLLVCAAAVPATSTLSETLDGQAESCGHAAARVAVWLLEHECKTVPLPDRKVLSLLEIKDGLEGVGLATFGARFRDPDALPIGLPAIVPLSRLDGHSGPAHFVVLVRHADGRASMVDYPSSPRLVSLTKLRETGRWDGTALVVARTSQHLQEIALNARFLPGPVNVALAAVGVLMLAGLAVGKISRVKKEAADANRS